MTRLFSYFNVCNIYTLGWSLYLLQGILYPKGSIISQGLLLVLLALSLYFLLKKIDSDKNPFLRASRILVIVATIYGSFFWIWPDIDISNPYTNPVSFVKVFYISFLPPFMYYHFAKNGYMSENWFVFWGAIFLIISYMIFSGTKDELLEEAISRGSNREEFTNNTGYRFLELFPLLFFLRKQRVIQLLCALIIMSFILLSMKRGAIFIGFLCFIYFLYSSIRNCNNSQRFILLILCSITSLILYKYVNQLIGTSDYFSERITATITGDTSGRDVLYKMFYNRLFDQDFLYTIIGNGPQATVVIGQEHAHNDWLEFAIDMGLIGLLVYYYYWRKMLTCIRNINKSDITYQVLVLVFVINLSKTFFSMTYDDITVFTTSVLGYCIYKSQFSNKVNFNYEQF